MKEVEEINDMIRTVREDEVAANEEHLEINTKKVIINVES